ncbi:hypothetical protein BDW02DRAFT_570140 [Decorospora gaudefroyi]|uniref:Uncharacterized protein n=1 Tax=Decorospora gaudefroyi TaxID=184978 RepID=A0A6A5KDB0_9PLEO|nr:hypothetical protein BDW02DRAFT_570140 [Decorospora gaudefroyi]
MSSGNLSLLHLSLLALSVHSASALEHLSKRSRTSLSLSPHTTSPTYLPPLFVNQTVRSQTRKSSTSLSLPLNKKPIRDIFLSHARSQSGTLEFGLARDPACASCRCRVHRRDGEGDGQTWG